MSASKFTPKAAPAIVDEAVIRTPRAAKPKATAQPTPAEAMHTEAAPMPDSAAFAGLMAGFVMPSGMRMMAATVCGLLAYAGSIYWSAQALNYLAVAALLFTGSSFLVFAISIVGWFFAIVGAIRIGYKVGAFVLGFKTSDVTDSCEAVKASVTTRAGRLTNWFKSGKAVA